MPPLVFIIINRYFASFFRERNTLSYFKKVKFFEETVAALIKVGNSEQIGKVHSRIQLQAENNLCLGHPSIWFALGKNRILTWTKGDHLQLSVLMNLYDVRKKMLETINLTHSWRNINTHVIYTSSSANLPIKVLLSLSSSSAVKYCRNINYVWYLYTRSINLLALTSTKLLNI